MKTYTISDVEKALKAAVKQMENGIEAYPFENEEAYAHFLAQTYYMVRHTTRILTISAGRMPLELNQFHQFYLHHLREENGHEQLALNDLEVLGWNIQDLPEAMHTQFIVQSQYYWLDRSPFGAFGYAWCLECLAVRKGREVIQRVQPIHGSECHTFLQVHAEEDVDHIEENEMRARAIPANYYEKLISNIEQTGYLYPAILNEVAAKCSSNVKKLKAA